MPNLDIDLLRTFLAIIERESFAGGAEAVHRTQSAVTQQMQRLEAEVGAPLFRKVGRNKQVTDRGLKLLDYARQMLALNDEAYLAVSGASLSGQVRFGATNDVADTILPNLLTRFVKAYPDLRMEIHVGRSPHLMQALKRGDIDMAISTRDDPEHRRITLRNSPTVWICAADYNYDASQPVSLVLADEPSLFRRLALEALDAARHPWRIAYLAPTLTGIRAAVRAGLGVTARSVEMLGPDFRVLGESDGLPRLPEVQFHLYQGNRNVSPAARRLFESLAPRLLG